MWGLHELPLLGRENTSPDRPRRATISGDLLRKIESMTVVDRALYEAARSRAPVEEIS